jgi:hypothetical protein
LPQCHAALWFFSRQITFDGSSGPSAALAAGAPLPPLPLPVTVAPCPAGFQPASTLDNCVECSDGTYNLDGGACLPCPSGASLLLTLCMQPVSGCLLYRSDDRTGWQVELTLLEALDCSSCSFVQFPREHAGAEPCALNQ